MLNIHLLGNPQVFVDEKLVPESAWKTRHAFLALGVLACARNPISARQLGALLWPDKEPDRAVMLAKKAVGLRRS